MLEKPTLSVIILGQANSGKTTLAVQLLHSLGTINSSIMERVESGMQLDSSDSIRNYASVLSRTKDEIKRGRTMNLVYSMAETKHFHLNIIDAPANPFLKSMFRGISQANIGIVVLDAEIGAFEAGIPNITTMIRATYCLGSIQLIFCVNKMESVDYSKTRFMEIKSEITKIYKNNGYKNGNATVIPISALSSLLGNHNDDNILEPACGSKMEWYKGGRPCLLDAINSLKAPLYRYDLPLRISISKVFNLKGALVVFGKIETGILKLETEIRLTPHKKQFPPSMKIESIAICRKLVREAKAGQLVTIQLKTSLNPSNVKPGMVLSDFNNDYAKEVHSFKADIAVLRESPFRRGYNPTFNIHSLQTSCKFKDFYVSSNTIKRYERDENPMELRKGQYATVLLKPKNQIYVATVYSYPPFGRFLMWDNGNICVFGVITEVYTDSPPRR
ncbi:predicted protein [Naegleria gruberi]|uniref:Predicted protein n=1 Tax=Naegleria gruberi TaxID=5762 RepID=D2VYN5_NAEGR|nr:uncharacterized protein NAEGRDRAFT_60950 [Naegleria gruberi]EFC38145.1 predicted protein [Naegleria gruberi]|eukprot:XP_002670889.1 predicted protein [Naegleria gruberi strain NEG-M]